MQDSKVHIYIHSLDSNYHKSYRFTYLLNLHNHLRPRSVLQWKQTWNLFENNA